MSPGSSTERYPAFAHIGLRENPGINLNQSESPSFTTIQNNRVVTLNKKFICNFLYRIMEQTPKSSYEEVRPMGTVKSKVREVAKKLGAHQRVCITRDTNGASFAYKIEPLFGRH
ncbi:hypothetical protein ANN_08123 [Periplaneta americana]|uniref:Uncharacterized protein n=1 Tax=Periplaneta americana TaxID=6978 RepID=A0ABQ8T0I1_PERAM|nr:hypothetical protein ANN_08123 [Periplaneta americana]